MKTDYLSQTIRLLQETQTRLVPQMEQAAQWIADAITEDHLIWVFGASHAGILAEELFYRAGGLACVSPLFVPGMTCQVRPVTLTSTLERRDGLAADTVREARIEPGDVLIIHSVSGRNAAPVEVALVGKERGAKTIGLTSLAYSQSVTARSATGKRLFEVVDLVLDNGAPEGDALVDLQGFAQRVSPVSTVLGAAILNAVMAEACALLLERGIQPPVFLSANLEGGDAHNARLLDRYRGRVLYL